MRYKLMMVSGYIAATMTACATYKAILKNERNQTITCERFGPSEIVTGYFLSVGLREKFDDCFKEADARSFFKDPPRGGH